MSDPSRVGLAQSAGMTVNYIYEEAALVTNHEAFVNEGRIAHSRAIRSLAEAAPERGRGAGRGLAPGGNRV